MMDLALQLLGTGFGGAFSSLVGWAAARRLPRPILRRVILWYSKFYGVNLAEAALPPEGYSTFLEFFTRPLKPGLRPLDPDPSSLVSPADGALNIHFDLQPDSLLQAKEITYRMTDLIGNADWAERWRGGAYLNFYLNPADYHRFHAPADLEVLEAVHLPGRLYPVNSWSRSQVPALFAQNERVVLRARIAGGEVLFVAVAATSVGKVRFVFEAPTTHNGARSAEHRAYASPVRVARGDELGRFELGSTILLFTQPGLCRLDPRPEGARVRVGEKLGALLLGPSPTA